jgi:tripeptide aminopeptidase
VEGGIVRGEGTILGGDARAGCAVLLALAAEWARAPAAGRPSVRLLFSVCEEVNLLGSRALAPAEAAADLAYVLDSSTPVGTLIVASPDALEVEAEFEGRAAHAGLHPEEGRSAIAMIARALGGLPLGRLDSETTANVGRIGGGEAINVVPDRAFFQGEIRSFREGGAAEVAGLWRSICESAARSLDGRCSLAVREAFRSYRHVPEAPVLGRAAAACERLGIPVSPARTPGGSDANTLNALGTPALVLGTGNRHPHSAFEEIRVEDLLSLTRLVREIVAGE